LVLMTDLFFTMRAKADKSPRTASYHDVCIQKGEEYWNYERFQLKNSFFIDPENYRITGRISSGKFSDVMGAIDLRYKAGGKRKLVVLKILKPIHIKKVRREVKILRQLKNGPNIIGFYGLCRDNLTKTITLVFEHLGPETRCFYHGSNRPNPASSTTAASQNEETTLNDEFNRNLTLYEIKLFMYRLLEALDYSHSQGIMHRDVKPRNIIFNLRTNEIRLIDWGLADFYVTNRLSVSKVGSRHYKAPELLIGVKYYDYGVDMFSTGCVLAGLLFMREPFFRSSTNDEQLEKICTVLGSEGLLEVVDKYNIELDPKLRVWIGRHKKRSLWVYRTEDNRHLIEESGIDLLEKMLCYDMQERITAKGAMEHPFFDEIRGKNLSESTESLSKEDEVGESFS